MNAELNIYVTENQSFEVKVLDPTISYGLTFTKETEVNRWLAKCDMRYYQNQVNFAVYCATTLCGLPEISSISEPLIKSVYQFHFYYQVRKILKNLQVPLPTDNTFNASNNNINITQFTRLCNEFKISTSTDFRTKKGDNNGLGTMQFMGHFIHGNGYIEHRNNYALPDKHYTFSQSHYIAKIERIQQNNYGWEYFIQAKFQKLTQPGIVRLNDSIRTYVYCILASQAETRSAIIGQFGTELDAQKQFIKLLEDSINQHADIPTSIARYQKSLSDTHKRLDYVIGPGLYIIPSDMILKVGTIENYNNNILIANENMNPGKNDINSEKNTPPPLMKGPTIKRSVLKTNNEVGDSKAERVKPDEVVEKKDSKAEISDHENIKFYLFLATGGLVTLALYFS